MPYEITMRTLPNSYGTTSGPLNVTEREARALFEKDRATLDRGMELTLWNDRGEILAIAQGQADGIFEELRRRGFAEASTGGGCVAQRLERGTCEILVTSASDGGASMPTDDDWLIGAYDEDGKTLCLCDIRDGGDFARAIAQAIEAAEAADMEQSAKRRGDI